jgi:hypothetical protein
LNRASADEMKAIGVTDEFADLICRVRPFQTWSELEEAVGSSCAIWQILRQKFFLGITPG